MEMASMDKLQRLANIFDESRFLFTDKDVADIAIIIKRAVERKVGEELEC